jgi:hypothetical protein
MYMLVCAFRYLNGQYNVPFQPYKRWARMCMVYFCSSLLECCGCLCVWMLGISSLCFTVSDLSYNEMICSSLAFSRKTFYIKADNSSRICSLQRLLLVNCSGGKWFSFIFIWMSEQLQYLNIYLTQVHGLRRRISDGLDFQLIRQTLMVHYSYHLVIYRFS